MEYITEGHRYSWSYQELRENYIEILEMTDKEFLNNLPKILHFSCFCGFVKEVPNEWLVGDRGIIHELVHILEHGEEYFKNRSLKEIREDFKNILELS